MNFTTFDEFAAFLRENDTRTLVVSATEYDYWRERTAPLDVQQLAENARQWVSSPEGKLAVQSALQIARETTARLHKARRVDPKSLHEPVSL